MPTLILCLLLGPISLNRLGVHAFARGEYAAAEQLFLLAWRQQPDANIASNLAATARRQQNWPQADRWFTHVIELRTKALGNAHPDTAIAYNNRGETRLAAGRLAAARADLEQALALTQSPPDRAVILHNLGDLERRQGNFTAAQAALAESLHLRPHSPPTSQLLAALLAALGEAALDRAHLRDALRLCQQAAALAPVPAERCQARLRALVVEVPR
jgi:tetratricopeptide (TPR) repeat protein